MATVGELMRETEELRFKELVWRGVREYLERFTPEGGGSSSVEINGVSVPQDIVLDVIAKIDSMCLFPIQTRMRAISSFGVKDEQEKWVGEKFEGANGRVGDPNRGDGD